MYYSTVSVLKRTHQNRGRTTFYLEARVGGLHKGGISRDLGQSGALEAHGGGKYRGRAW